jgi:subtilisin family serine protease
VAQGLDYALAPREGGRCDVVSLSHGGLPSKAWAEAVNRLYEAGTVVVAASGDSFYFEVIDVATHFTVYPSAFYRVVTATGATFNKGPYITNDFGTMQGCWGPDKVMHKAIAAYTPNVPWMANQSNPNGWDMNGGGTSASTPQIAAACALWLKQYGSQFPVGWQRVEACRHALFESAAAKGQNVSQIGVGLLDAGAMLRPSTFGQAQQAFATGTLRYAPPDDVSFPFLRLLFGLPPPGAGIDEMYETEAAQIFFRSKNADLAAAVAANPDGDPAAAPLSSTDRKTLRDAFIAEPSISNTLKAYLQTRAVQNP